MVGYLARQAWETASHPRLLPLCYTSLTLDECAVADLPCMCMMPSISYDTSYVYEVCVSFYLERSSRQDSCVLSVTVMQ